MRKTVYLVVLVVACAVKVANAQDDKESINELSLNGYADAYLATYDTDLDQQTFQDLTGVGPRDNTFGVNIAQIGMNYENDFMRSEVVFHMGDIAQATWNANYQALQAANVGVKLKEGLWLDAGFFRTHIGTESFLPKNNMLSSISFITYIGPFYQAGAKLSWDISEQLYAELWALNGYNSFIDNNDSKSVGGLLRYTISENTMITYTNLYGRENFATIGPKQRRFYHNVYVNQIFNNQISLTTGIDLSTQSNSDLGNPTKGATMFGALVTARYQLNPQWSMTGRVEYIKDGDGIISGLYTDVNGFPAGLEIFGLTVGGEYKPTDGTYLRSEFRYAQAPGDLLVFSDSSPSNERLEFMITLGVELDKIIAFK